MDDRMELEIVRTVELLKASMPRKETRPQRIDLLRVAVGSISKLYLTGVFFAVLFKEREHSIDVFGRRLHFGIENRKNVRQGLTFIFAEIHQLDLYTLFSEILGGTKHLLKGKSVACGGNHKGGYHFTQLQHLINIYIGCPFFFFVFI